MHNFSPLIWKICRNKLKYGDLDELAATSLAMEGVKVINGLECKIACNSSKVYYCLILLAFGFAFFFFYFFKYLSVFFCCGLLFGTVLGLAPPLSSHRHTHNIFKARGPNANYNGRFFLYNLGTFKSTILCII